MIQWKDDYLIGVETIDEQHKKLFEIANRAYELLNNDMYIDKYDRIVVVLDELKDYTKYHFDYEEEYMKSIGYKGMFQQKVEHDGFIKKINEVNLNKIDEDQDAYLLSMLEFIVNWIGNHILKTDKLITSDIK